MEPDNYNAAVLGLFREALTVVLKNKKARLMAGLRMGGRGRWVNVEE